MSTPYSETPEGLRLTVRVTPRAGKDHVGGLATLGAEATALRVAVTAAPDDGRANEAVIKLLAKALHLPKSAITIERGTTARTKTLALAGEPGQLAFAVDSLAEAG